MTDPVAEAAAQLAAQAAEPTMLERAMDTIHDLEAKVEHLIHPDAPVIETKTYPDGTTATGVAPLPELSPTADAPGNAPAVAAASVTEAATAEGAGGAAVGEAVIDAPAVTSGAAASGIASAKDGTSELPNAAATPPAGAATDAAGDVPNVALAVAAPTAEPASASSAAGANTTSPIAASSADRGLLPTRIATHLEAIYALAKEHVETAPFVPNTSALKTHIGDILHRISNGMAVTEGELVTKLEALYRML
jgi:hypothetical protein